MRKQLAIVLAGAVTVTPALAATFAGTAVGGFNSYMGGPGTPPPTTISNNDAGGVAKFTFGDSQTSSITFNGFGSDGSGGFAGNVDTPFAIGGVTALKAATTSYPAVGTSITLTTTLSFTAPYSFSKVLSFTLDIGLFPGLLPGTMDANLFGNPDISPAMFVFSGRLYDLMLVGFDPDGFNNDISLQQGTAFTGNLYAQISLDPAPAPVPEPAGALLIATGLGGIIATRRR